MVRKVTCNYKGGHRNRGSLAWANKIVLQSRHASQRYGYKALALTAPEIVGMIAAHDNCCDLCRKPLALLGKKGLVIDHDHMTGRMRGIICQKCNASIAHLGDDLPGLQRAVEYLRRANG